jgi:CubicO group peptidase (beta-lactamase class C family)
MYKFFQGNLADNFRQLDHFYPVNTVRRIGPVFEFAQNPGHLPASYDYQGTTSNLVEFLELSQTTGLVVLRNEDLLLERYWHGYSKESLAVSFSVAKSFTSALVGISLAEGLFESVDDAVTEYVLDLNGSGYEGVPIKHILQMCSGIRFVEEYDQEDNDVMVMRRQIEEGKSIKAYAATLEAEHPSGQVYNYASVDTQVLGMLLENITGMSPSDYLQEKIWSVLGMESDAVWVTDEYGTVLTYSLFNVTLRDYAKFGLLYLNGGLWNGTRVISEDWIDASVTPEKDFLKLKDFYSEGWDIGYGYQWWVPDGTEGEFTAIGIYGQYIYVNPAREVVIVKTSADPLFDERDMETVAMFRSIAEHFST